MTYKIKIYWAIFQLFFILIFFTNLEAKNIGKFFGSNDYSNYFSGIISLNDEEYQSSYSFFKKLNGLEENHFNFSQNYLQTLASLNKYSEAYKYSKKLEKKSLSSFESELIIGIYYLKNNKLDNAKKYFSKLNNRKSLGSIKNLLSTSLINWVNFNQLDFVNSQKIMNSMDPRYENLKKIQTAFLHCYFENKNTSKVFENLVNDPQNDFSRYNFFYANYVFSTGNKNKTLKILNETSNLYPRNLLINQFKKSISEDTIDLRLNEFNCKNISHIIAELFYITSNVLASEGVYNASNFFLSLSMFLNPNFTSYKTLYAENFYMNKKFEKALDIYREIKKHGQIYNWYASKQISNILIKQDKKKQSIKYLTKVFLTIENPNVYELFDYAEFLKNNDEFKESISNYTKILKKIDKDHKLYPEVTDGRGVAYERIGEWNKAEIDLKASLDSSPDQAYVLNYLAYSWIEQGINIEKSLEMLRKANEIKQNDGYIIDSLGWALFKLKKYEEAKKYLELAVRLMPSDPVVNDHYGDSLWMTGNKIQARYFWNYVLNLDKTEIDLKEKINLKIYDGPRI